MNHSKTFYFKLPVKLGSVLGFFEVNCVPACCGLDAYDFDPIYASHAIASQGEAFVRSATEELEVFITQIRDLPEDWGVQSDEMNAAWSKADALKFFEMVGKDIQDGLAIGAVRPNEPHARHDANQRFNRG